MNTNIFKVISGKDRDYAVSITVSGRISSIPGSLCTDGFFVFRDPGETDRRISMDFRKKLLEGFTSIVVKSSRASFEVIKELAESFSCYVKSRIFTVCRNKICYALLFRWKHRFFWGKYRSCALLSYAGGLRL